MVFSLTSGACVAGILQASSHKAGPFTSHASLQGIQWFETCLCAAHWESNRERAETEQGFSKESRAHRDSSHHVCNIARLKPPDGAHDLDAGEGSAEHSGDSAYERPQGVLYEDSLPASPQRPCTTIM